MIFFSKNWKNVIRHPNLGSYQKIENKINSAAKSSQLPHIKLLTTFLDLKICVGLYPDLQRYN